MRSLLKWPWAADRPPKVSYFEKSKVDAAFAKGAVLLDGSNGRNYMVHASRREKPGQSEIHTKDTDIIYVLEGKATIVTARVSDDAKNIAADELRGTSIRNGQTAFVRQRRRKWRARRRARDKFVEVSDRFLYYVVKVR